MILLAPEAREGMWWWFSFWSRLIACQLAKRAFLAPCLFLFQLAVGKSFPRDLEIWGKCLTQLGDSVKLLLGRLGSTLRVLGVSWEFLVQITKTFGLLGRLLGEFLPKSLESLVAWFRALTLHSVLTILTSRCTSAPLHLNGRTMMSTRASSWN